jgi:hypothetical protein
MLITESELTEHLLGKLAEGRPLPEQGGPSRWAQPAELVTALTRRRTVRSFAATPVDAAALAAVLAESGPRPAGLRLTAVTATQWPERDRPPGLDGLVTDPGTSALLYRQYADAPVLLLYHGTPDDPADYFRLLAAAGRHGCTAWLSAVRHGLAGGPYGRASGFARAAIRRAGHATDHHLFTMALGHPSVEDAR